MRFNTFSLQCNDKICEDYILYGELPNGYYLAILADGMGGLSFGSEASKIVSNVIYDFVSTNFSIYEPNELIRKAFDIANERILQRNYELKCKMGSAICVVLVSQELLYYAWQGNVRLYKEENKNLTLLTVDHVIEFNKTSLLTRCINGKGYRNPILVNTESVKKGDILYLCSDGYYKNAETIGTHKVNRIDDDASILEIEI
ncbi:MAG: protein phosphatase 2C domain-containing protein [Paludibacteraceae bacterium]|nr:protein phosphatase 2C domain-containing protein [Paludibacteraceae bacterium]